jgi:hypothetical protein
MESVSYQYLLSMLEAFGLNAHHWATCRSVRSTRSQNDPTPFLILPPAQSQWRRDDGLQRCLSSSRLFDQRRKSRSLCDTETARIYASKRFLPILMVSKTASIRMPGGSCITNIKMCKSHQWLHLVPGKKTSRTHTYFHRDTASVSRLCVAALTAGYVPSKSKNIQQAGFPDGHPL